MCESVSIVPPDFDETMNSVVSRSTASSSVEHGARVGRVEHVQPQAAGDLAERAPDHLRAEARAAHAEQRHVGEARPP